MSFIENLHREDAKDAKQNFGREVVVVGGGHAASFAKHPERSERAPPRTAA